MSRGQDGQDAGGHGFLGHMSLVGRVSVQTWHWFSQDQAIAAATFARKSGDLEANAKTPSDDERARDSNWSAQDQQEHRSYVTASILSSVTFFGSRHQRVVRIGKPFKPEYPSGHAAPDP
jgi:hypothetical protein